jgi:ribosomal protein S18 acetylase RimI-like enzyme
MSGFKFLFDTNVVIGLEDAHPVRVQLSDLVRKCSAKAIRIFIDGAVHDDVQRDTNAARRQITLSKLNKFEKLRDLPSIARADLEKKFGQIKTENDCSDARLLFAVDLKAVDFLITEDIGLHKRADRAGLGASILTVEEALNWIRITLEPKDVTLPFIVEKTAYQLDRRDPIFDGLREDYSGFDQWLDRCAQKHRECWVAEVGGTLAGILIRKDETHEQAGTRHAGPKILKLCTFKMKEEFRGEKFGEQLLKQALWFAQRNRYDLVYLTVFPKHGFLMELLQAYGFEVTTTIDTGELVLERPISHGSIPNDVDPLVVARRLYPRFSTRAGIRKFCVPIRADYHRILFPELAIAPELPLFPESIFGQATSQGTLGDRTPGNTIRKVYLCRAPSKRMRPGDVLFFYMSKDVEHRSSQSITSTGVIVQVSEASTIEDLLRLIGKRSVFSLEELHQILDQRPMPLKVIDFILTGHANPPVPLGVLLREGIFKNHPPQTITELTEAGFERLRHLIDIGFDL